MYNFKILGNTAEFHFPTRDNNGNDLQSVREGFRKDLGHEFGGYNETKVTGFWVEHYYLGTKEYRDEIIVISVSSEKLTINHIRSLAKEIAEIAGQKAVYFKVNGQAHLLEIE